MAIPEIHTREEITEILDKFSVACKRLSKDMFWIGMPDGYQIGSVALAQGEILCRFHYSDGNSIRNDTFVYDEARFAREIANARKAWKLKRDAETEALLDTLG